MTTPTVFRLASRLDDIGFSDIVNIRNRVMELRASGATVYQFEGGEPYMHTSDLIKEGMVRALAENSPTGSRTPPESSAPRFTLSGLPYSAFRILQRPDQDSNPKLLGRSEA